MSLETYKDNKINLFISSKTKEVVHIIRQVQQDETGVAGQNAFVGELASTVLQHRQTPSQPS